MFCNVEEPGGTLAPATEGIWMESKSVETVLYFVKSGRQLLSCLNGSEIFMCGERRSTANVRGAT